MGCSFIPLIGYPAAKPKASGCFSKPNPPLWATDPKQLANRSIWSQSPGPQKQPFQFHSLNYQLRTDPKSPVSTSKSPCPR
ncbi:hypothetical protein Hanom_Chr13g01198401 [Helianthus anomalus]